MTLVKKLSKLRRDFLAVCPVIGPHRNIHAEMMLAGVKPVCWISVYDVERSFAFSNFDDAKEHGDRLLLDEKVREGRLISMDATLTDGPKPFIIRHYAAPDSVELLEKIVRHNQHVFNRQKPPKTDLDQDHGVYLRYRKRDIWYFNNVMNHRRVPHFIHKQLLWLNQFTQSALRNKLLADAGIDLKTWKQHDTPKKVYRMYN